MAEAQESHFREITESDNENPWGLAYRMSAGRSKTPGNIVNCIRFREDVPDNVDDAIGAMLNALLPDDDPSSDIAHHRQVGIVALTSPSGTPAPPIGAGHLGRIIRKLPNTSLGIDGVTARIVKEAWKVIVVEMNMMYEKCVKEGIFPGIWKEGRFVVLPKGNDRPATDPKAYRPLTLLLVLGKVLERVVIQLTREKLGSISREQDGFTKGRSTVTTLTDILEAVGTSISKYVCMLLNYFSCRRVRLFVGCRAGWKATTMGCPQGSILGPMLWNLLLSDIFRLPLPGGCKLIAYADDVTAVIEGDNIAELKRNGTALLSFLAEWGRRNRLTSPRKSATMMIKGKLQRPPNMRIDATSIAAVTYAKVRGVGIDSGLSFGAHAKNIGTRDKMLWASYYMVRSALLSAQRPALILLTKAYRSTSTHALPVLTGSYPPTSCGS
ncbi:Putative 115 kDa protein in type-1 retrotransposable element R1DM [Eumeta japonica]|uniref:115 kDa protein in type-1 retrotransposable element R1DM n=1 Tax=Eumeta variegata TaxID=151549 RepID=A0A4C1VU41_EUMVA|nr:Putative 115 kDa protein in type-1 retrotransposable element R1DM [Eumeta japonica]